MAWLGAAAMVVAGIRLLAAGLEGWAGSRAAGWLRRGPGAWASLAAGLVATLILQSSSATTVLVVGAAHAGWLDDAAALMAVMGANVGTALASQLWAQPLPWLGPALYALAATLLLAGGGRATAAAQAALGLALTLDALERLAALAAPLAGAPGAGPALARAAGDPRAAFLAGVVLTAVIDSSGAAVALAQRLADAGALPLAAAFRFTYGADVGTTAGTLLAALPLGPAARRAACAHLLFNVASAAWFWPLTEPLAEALGRAAGSPARAVAHLHALLNVIPALLLAPARGAVVAVLRRLVP